MPSSDGLTKDDNRTKTDDPFSRNKSARESVDVSGEKKTLKVTDAYLPKEQKRCHA